MLQRILKVLLGVVLVVAGIAMLVLPGPGLLTIALGVALMLSQWPRGRRMLAALRVRLRERFGSRRVRRVERCLPDEVCPPQPTEQLRAIAASEAPPPPAPDELALTPDDVLSPDCEPEAR
jgi:UPF0716 family protein affecting phage T7 exclusion